MLARKRWFGVTMIEVKFLGKGMIQIFFKFNSVE